MKTCRYLLSYNIRSLNKFNRQVVCVGRHYYYRVKKPTAESRNYIIKITTMIAGNMLFNITQIQSYLRNDPNVRRVDIIIKILF